MPKDNLEGELQAAIDQLINRHSEAEVRKAISRSTKHRLGRSLTIVVNFGMHSLPEEILKGDVFFFSEGNLELSPNKIKDTFRTLTTRAIRFLRGKIWENIYIVPSGHPALVVLCTLVTYRVTRVDPTITYYMDGIYNDVKLDIRSDSLKKNTLS